MSQRITGIIRQYKRWKNQNPDSWVAHCRAQRTLQGAIHSATLSENAAGQKHPHQYRLKRTDLENFEANLLQNKSAIQTSADFDSLHTIVKESACKGIGELTIYDTAVRLGAFLNLYPDRIYLHAGTRVGANKLVPNLTGAAINKSQLPVPLRNSDLNCYELEDLLCVYKDQF
jgi:hypothetical protein